MQLRHAIWATAIWTVLGCGGSALGLWYVMSHPVPGVRAEDRANKLGGGAGTVLAIGYGAIWLPFA